MEKKYRIKFFPTKYDMKEWKNCTKICVTSGIALQFRDSENKFVQICGHWIVEEEK